MSNDESWQLPDISAGSLKVVLARNEADLLNSQRLRYSIYIDEMGGTPSASALETKLDVDDFDAVCDHLQVIDTALIGKENPVVGTYRLLRGQVAQKFGRFYSASEFDISPMLSVDGEVMELGRSCVKKAYRSRSAMQLLWRGIGAYVVHYDVEYMFGCASFMGLDVEPLKPALSFLYHHCLAPEPLRLHALPEQRVEMNWMPKSDCSDLSVVASMPPLIKGYLKLGCFVGDGAVLDPVANTTDVSIILPTQSVAERYLERYAGKKAKK